MAIVAARASVTQYDLSPGKPPELSLTQKPLVICSECERLWKIYSDATRRYLDATLAKDDPAEDRDIDRKKFLENQALEASQWRELARKAIRDHVATHAAPAPDTPD